MNANCSILKTLTILYVEDSKIMRMQVNSFLSEHFKKVIVAEDGQEGLDTFIKYKDDIDIILSDIVMPNLTGIQMIEKIREIDFQIPCVMTTSLIGADIFVKVIELNVSGYAIKPINFDQLLKTLIEVGLIVDNKQKLHQKENEVKQYVDALNGTAIVSKTDLDGNITDVNELFCEVSQYTAIELIGTNHNIVRHPDVDKKIYAGMWDSLKNGKTWKGTIKNKSKDGSAYFVKSFVFPIFNQLGEMVEYMAVRILTTEEENAKRDFQKGVVKNITKNRMVEATLKQEKLKLEENNKELQTKMIYFEKELSQAQAANNFLKTKLKIQADKQGFKQEKFQPNEVKNFE